MSDGRPTDANGPRDLDRAPQVPAPSTPQSDLEALRYPREPHAAPAPGALPLLEVTSVARHAVRGEVGRGGMGAVYRLHDRALLREVAMKSTDPGVPADPGALQLLMEEAQITGQLEHPHIVPVHDIGLGASGTSVHFTMKLVKGSTLTSLIEELHGQPWDDRAAERLLQIIVKVCDALAFAHSRGVVHRDLKPDNVMVGTFGQVYLMDWGLAMLVPALAARVPPERREEARPVSVSSPDGGRRDEPGVFAGTPECMAPEQIWGHTNRIDARTDVFGLGGLLYHLLTGHGPNHRSRGTGGAAQPLKPGSVVPPDQCGAWPNLPPELCRITQKALSERQEDRYQTVADLQGELEEFLRGGGWFATRRYPAGAVIVQQGDAATEAYMLVDGSCDVLKTTGETRYLLRRLAAGDVFGEMAILTGERRSATVVATTDVTVKVVTAEAFEREFSRRSWAGVFVRAIAARFRDVDGQLASVRGGT